MKELHSEGKCVFCGKTFAKAAISKHLNSHFKNDFISKSCEKSYHVRVECAEMFLNLWVDGNALLEDVDDFLRAIWLECCGHMSSFSDPAAKKAVRRGVVLFNDGDDFMIPGEISKDEKASDVLVKNMKLDYEYDFGSTTRLEIKVLEEFSCKAVKNIVLLSRNMPLEIYCLVCKKNIATVICSVCAGYDVALFCKACAKLHEKECEDFPDCSLPVVNSPRMGVCGYEGGQTDKARDGVLKRNHSMNGIQ